MSRQSELHYRVRQIGCAWSREVFTETDPHVVTKVVSLKSVKDASRGYERVD